MLFKNFAVNQRFNVSMRGGGQRVNYFLNASIFNENGILKKPKETPLDITMNNQKYLFQSNVSAMMTKTTKVSLKAQHPVAVQQCSLRVDQRPVLLGHASQSRAFPRGAARRGRRHVRALR